MTTRRIRAVGSPTCYQPTLIYQIKGPDGKIAPRPPRIRSELTRDLNLSKDQIEMVRALNARMVEMPEFEASLLPVGDGLLVAVSK